LRTASRELLAPRADVWGFLAEPYHLSDWWPGLAGIELDRRGFAPGARWKARVQTHNVFTGRGVRETMLIVGEIEPFERWTWQLLKPRLHVEVRLRSLAPDRTLVTCTTSGRRPLPALALKRLYDLVQTAAVL
jgi:uncharacterized protein YndB with AHSA1/START domain